MKLIVKDLSVKLSGVQILENLRLTVEDGAFVALLGPSGCGKTTLLKTIAGVLPHESGEIYLDARRIDALPAHKRRAVILFQDIRLFPHMTVLGNICYPMKMQGVPKAQYIPAALEMLDRVRLNPLAKMMPHTLSGGQQQRVALARALAASPHILLLDEPFSSLDEELRQEMRELVLSLHRQTPVTTLLVTHDRTEAQQMSDRIVYMQGGALKGG